LDVNIGGVLLRINGTARSFLNSPSKNRLTLFLSQPRGCSKSLYKDRSPSKKLLVLNPAVSGPQAGILNIARFKNPIASACPNIGIILHDRHLVYFSDESLNRGNPASRFQSPISPHPVEWVTTGSSMVSLKNNLKDCIHEDYGKYTNDAYAASLITTFCFYGTLS
jgi:hypothetical protein